MNEEHKYLVVKIDADGTPTIEGHTNDPSIANVMAVITKNLFDDEQAEIRIYEVIA